jgi:hypothetical protein
MHLRILLSIAACLATLGLAACGGDDETTSSSSTTTTTETTGAETTGDADAGDSADASTLREQFDEQLLQILTTTQGMSRSEAQCAVEELDSRISDEEIQDAIAEAAQTGQSPQDLIDEAFDAGAECSEK